VLVIESGQLPCRLAQLLLRMTFCQQGRQSRQRGSRLLPPYQWPRQLAAWSDPMQRHCPPQRVRSQLGHPSLSTLCRQAETKEPAHPRVLCTIAPLDGRVTTSQYGFEGSVVNRLEVPAVATAPKGVADFLIRASRHQLTNETASAAVLYFAVSPLVKRAHSRLHMQHPLLKCIQRAFYGKRVLSGVRSIEVDSWS
jgi:hypothetical protein